MELITRIINYSFDTKKIREEINEELLELKNKFDFDIAKIDQEIINLKNEIKEHQKTLLVFQKELKERIAYDCKKMVYVGISEALSIFEIQNDLGLSADIESKEVLEKKILELLKKIKNINDVLMENKNNEKKKLSNDYSEKKQKIEEKKLQLLNHIRLPLINDYNANYERCVSKFVSADEPVYAENLPYSITIGNYLINSNEELKEISNDNVLMVPCDIDVENKGNIVIKINTNSIYDDNRIEDVITGMALKYIEAYPSGHLKLGIYSSSISSFGKLIALFSGSLRGKINLTQETCKTMTQFSKMLLSISEKGEIINSKLLENGCNNIYDLYERDIKTEDFQLVIIHDVFKDMSLDNINQLHGCLSELSRCGLRFIIIDDFTPELYKNKSSAFVSKMNQILEHSNVFDLSEKKFVDKNNNELEFADSSNISFQDVYNFINKYCELSNLNKASYLSYEKVGFGKEYADVNNFDSINIPVALADPNVWEIKFDCVGHSPNANLIVGIPGTGKSTLIDSLIMNGSMKYSPDEIVFQLLDFKDGISSSVYTMENCRIPHIKVVSQNNKPEDAEIILSNILAESEKRNKEFVSLRQETGETIRNIVEYNKLVSTGKFNRTNMPRLIIVIDECQYLFEEESLAKKCQDIVRKCRSQGIHLILATQTLSHKMWSTVKFIEGVYCFEIAKDDAEQLLSRKYASLVSTEIPKGSFMAFASNDEGNECTKIRVAFDGGNTAKYAQLIRTKWNSYKLDMVTIGDKSPKLITLKELEDLYTKCDKFELPIGENYTDHSPLCISYYKKRPMFLVGTYQHASDSIMESLIFAAHKNNIKTYLIDASENQNVKSFANKLNNNVISIGDETNYLESLQKIYELYKERENNIRGENPPVFFIVNSLQSIIDFLNNKKYSKHTDVSNASISSDRPMSEIIAMATAKRQQNDSLIASGKDTMAYLIANAYKVNIFICFSMDTIMLTNDLGEQVLGFSQRNIIRTCDYKILYPNCSSDIRNVMEDSFKERMLNGMTENMAFLSLEQRDFFKFRYYQLSEEEE